VSPSSPTSASRAAGAALAALLTASAPAAAAIRLDVGGALEPADAGLRVRLDVTNRGDVAALHVDVEAEIFGLYAEGRLPGPLAPGATQSVRLDFTAAPARPGVHALALHLRYPVSGQTETASQRAYLLLALGSHGPPAVRLAPRPTTFETRGSLDVDLESADGRPHTVQVRVLGPRGVNALAEAPVDVPARGPARATVPLIRTGPSRNERLGVVVLAASTDDGLQDTVATTAVVDLVAHKPWMPRLRIPIAVLSIALLFAAIALEFRRSSTPN